MTLIGRIKNALYPESNLTTPEKWLVETLGSRDGIDENTALQVVACYACVRLLSEQIAIMPIGLYSNGKEGRIKETDHPLYRILNSEPNPYMTAFTFWSAMMFNKLLTGRGYAEVERDRKTKEVKALWPIPSKRVEKKINKKGAPIYEVLMPDGELKIIPYGNMLEISGLTPDGYAVYKPIEMLKNALGLARAAELYSKEYFDEGTHPSGVITYPGALRGEKQDEFKRQVKSAYGGLGKHHRVMLMEDGMKFERIAAPPNEGQMFESRKFQVIEIARFFNVPPHKIMEMDRATYNNIEEMNIQFVNDSLMPHCRSIEQSSNQTLIFDFEKEKDGLYVEFNLNSLLKGRLEDRFNSYAKARQWGWLNVNEIRKMENMPDIGERGEVYMEPLNMRGAGEGGND